MTDQEQNIAVAEACGWTFLPERDTHCGVMPECWESPDGERVQESPYPFPNYGADLNAMHEAEKTLSPHQRAAYYLELWAICNQTSEVASTARWLVPTATAAQRREAFLRTIGKWKE